MNAIRCFFTMWILMLGVPALAQEGSDGTSGTKSATTATLLSLIGTAVPIAQGIHDWSKTDGDHGSGAIIGGYMLGPAVGHFYAGTPGAAFGGIGLRLLPLLGLGAATAASWDSPSKAADIAAVGSLALASGLVVWDIARASKSVRSRNELVTHPRLSVGAVRGDHELTPVLRIDIRM